MAEANDEWLGAKLAGMMTAEQSTYLGAEVLANSSSLEIARAMFLPLFSTSKMGLEAAIANFDSFVIKPAKGSAGKGITVITHRQNNAFIQANGDPISVHNIQRHVSNILSGLYSLGGKLDIAMIEALVNFDRVLKALRFVEQLGQSFLKIFVSGSLHGSRMFGHVSW